MQTNREEPVNRQWFGEAREKLSYRDGRGRAQGNGLELKGQTGTSPKLKERKGNMGRKPEMRRKKVERDQVRVS